MAAGDAHWKVGVINTPGSTGTVAYTGLGSQPKAVFFWTTNFATEDSIVTSSNSTIGRGTAVDTGSGIKQICSALSASNVAHFTVLSAVYSPNPSFAANLYRADLDSFDSDGFTLDWTVATSGYKVVYAALMDVANSAGVEVTGSGTTSLGWKAGAALMQGMWGTPPQSDTDRSQEYFGGGAYPTTSSINWQSAGLTSFVFPTAAGSGQYNIGIYDDGPHIVVAQGGNFIGPFLTTQDITMEPTGTGLNSFTVDTNTVDNYALAAVWDDEASAAGRTTPAASTSGTDTTSGLPFAPGLLVGYSISNEPQGQASGATRSAVGFSVVAPGFQWSALIDRDSGAAAYQSFQRGVIDALTPTAVHAGEIDLTNDGFVITTAEDDTTAQSWVWHAFGHPDREHMWTPHIYRRLVAA